MRRLKQNSGCGAQGKRSCGWEDNIKMNLLETGCICELDWFRIVPMSSFGNKITTFFIP
jgi:hypothetical protein